MAEVDRLTGLVGYSGVKVPVACVAVANVTRSGEQIIDGVQTASSRVLLTAETSSIDNGIWVTDSGDWERAKDADGAYDFVQGSLVPVYGGTVYSGTLWQQQTASPVPDTTALTFAAYLTQSMLPVTVANGGTGQTTLAKALAALGLNILTAAAGTANAITSAAQSSATLQLNGLYLLTPAANNSAATTLSFTPSGGAATVAKPVLANGAACAGGELLLGVPTLLQYDGTSFNIVGPSLTGITQAAGNNSLKLATTAFVQAAISTAPRNRIINSGFQIDQRVNSATSRADDTYCLDRWYALTQTNTITVTQQTASEDGTPFNVRLTQAQAVAQRMGLATILEARDCKDLRAQAIAATARVRCSSSQALRIAVVEWTSTEDSPTSDIVNDWTSAVYSAGNFFIANTVVTAIGSITPAANTWTDTGTITGTAGSTGNNFLLMIWTEAVAAQNVTLDIARTRLVKGATAPSWEPLQFADELLACQRYYCKTFPRATAPAQNAGRSGDFETAGQAGGVTCGGDFRFPTVMRISPTVTTYNPSAANANWRDHSGAADRTVSTLDTSDAHVSLGYTSTNSITGIHITADAEL